MFDLTSSKILILGIVALIVVGPKELPFLLRTIGKYVGMLRRHANEFRAQFDEAMREAELESLKNEVESVARDAESTLRDAQTAVERDVHAATTELDHSLRQTSQLETTEASAAPPVATAADTVHEFDPLNGLDAAATPAVPGPVSGPVPAASLPHPLAPAVNSESATALHLEPTIAATEPAPTLARTGT